MKYVTCTISLRWLGDEVEEFNSFLPPPPFFFFSGLYILCIFKFDNENVLMLFLGTDKKRILRLLVTIKQKIPRNKVSILSLK